MTQASGDAVRAVIDQVLAMEDPARRARAITELLGAVREREGEMKAARKADVLLMRESLTLREVGERIGVNTSRVDQIAKGVSKQKPPVT